jgi:hypothetical protein
MAQKLALALLIAFAGLTAAAQADTFCVNKSGPQCSHTDATVQDALQDAADNSGADTVEIGPGSYSRAGGFSYPTNGEVLHVLGSGPSTVLTAPSGTTPVLAVDAAPDSTVESLAVQMPAANSASVGIAAATDGPISSGHSPLTLEGVSVGAVPAASAPVGITLNSAIARHSNVTLPDVVSGNGTGVRIDASAPTDDELTAVVIQAHTGVHSDFSRLTNVDITANRGVVATSSTACGSCLVRVVGADGIGVHGDASGIGLNLSVENSTIVGDGSLGSIGVFADGSANGENLNMWDTIIRGTATSLKASNADLQPTGGYVDYNDFDFATEDLGGETHGAHDVNVDPHFVDAAAGDYRLRFDSPLINAGNPNVGSAPTDLDGNPRPDGAAADLGAFEYQRRAPSVSAGAPSQSFVGDPVTFTANGSDPDHGDPLTYTWAFDDGTQATGPTAVHTFSTPGAHSGTVTVHDPTNQTASATATVAVASRPAALPAPGVSNLFKLAKARLNRKRGWIVLTLSLPAPGTVKVLGTAKSLTAVKASGRATRAGLYRITLKPRRKAARILRRKHRLKVPLALTYTPTGGAPRTTHKTVVFRLAKKG